MGGALAGATGFRISPPCGARDLIKKRPSLVRSGKHCVGWVEGHQSGCFKDARLPRNPTAGTSGARWVSGGWTLWVDGSGMPPQPNLPPGMTRAKGHGKHFVGWVEGHQSGCFKGARLPRNPTAGPSGARWVSGGWTLWVDGSGVPPSTQPTTRCDCGARDLIKKDPRLYEGLLPGGEHEGFRISPPVGRAIS